MCDIFVSKRELDVRFMAAPGRSIPGHKFHVQDFQREFILAAMNLKRVCCQGCGADLEVDGNVRFVTCNYCHAKLEVIHDPSVTHTRLMEKLEQNTERMAGNLKVIELQNDLERLDREWDSGKERFMVRGKQGHRHLPGQGNAMVGGIIGVVGGLAWMGFASSMRAPAAFILFGLLFVGLAAFGMISEMAKASAYRNAELSFQNRRNALLNRIEEARRD